MAKPKRRRDHEAIAKAKVTKKENGTVITVTRNAPPADLDPSLAWHLVFTAPRMEPKVKKALEEAGCVTFWPSEHFKVEHPRRKTLEYDLGLYPRYMFFSGTVFRERRVDRVIDEKTVITIDGRPVDDIQDIPGVSMVVSNCGKWVRIPSRAIAVMAGIQQGSIDPIARPLHPFSSGQSVVIGAGPLMGLKATIVDVLGVDQASLILEALSGRFEATMDLADIRAA